MARSRLFSGQERAGLHRPEASSFSGQKGAGLRRLTPAPCFRWAPRKEAGSLARVRHLTGRQAAGSAPERCRFRGPLGGRGAFFGKHSPWRPTETRKRRKPAFSVFSREGKAGFCRLCQFEPVSAKRGPYYLKEEPDPTEGPQRGPEGVFLTGFEGS